jgi:hypothetical protein
LAYIHSQEKGAYIGQTRKGPAILKTKYECGVVVPLNTDDVVFNVIDNMHFFNSTLHMPISAYVADSKTIYKEPPRMLFFCDLSSLIFPGSAAIIFKAADRSEAEQSVVEFVLIYYRTKKYSHSRIDKTFLFTKLFDITELIHDINEFGDREEDVYMSAPITSPML